MMCGDRWLTTGSPWEGDEMTEREQFEDMLMDYFGLGVAEGKEGRDHDDVNGSAQEKFHEIMRAWQAASATPALPQGVEQYLAECERCATIENNVLAFSMANYMRAYLSGMAIVPVEPTDEMIDYAERMDWSIPDSRAVVINIWQAMLAAAKEKS